MKSAEVVDDDGTARAGARLSSGERIEPMHLATIRGDRIAIPDSGGQIVHLQFRRFAGYPVCNLHLRSIAARHHELISAGIVEVAVFHSERETMLPFQGDLPFAVVADPEKALYRCFGVEASPRAVLDPRSWPAMLRGMMGRFPSNPMRGEGGHAGLPAEFLIDADGQVVASKYGVHADDHWSVDETLSEGASATRRSPNTPVL